MKYDNQNFIGIFDSGIGGISVLNELINRMPNENYIYFADTANFPYGKRTKSDLTNIGKNIIAEFDKINAKAVVIACNTMSTSDIESFKSAFPNIGIIGTYPNFTHIFKPGLVLSNHSISYDKDNKITINRDRKKLLIIATTATCKSDFLKQLVNDTKNIIDIYVEPADFMAKAVENDAINTFEFRRELSELFKEYKNLDYLMLGCTHFPFALDEIKNIVDGNVIITSGCETTVDNCYNYLTKNNLLSDIKNPKILIIDINLDDKKKLLYEKLLSKSIRSHNVEFSKTF